MTFRLTLVAVACVLCKLVSAKSAAIWNVDVPPGELTIALKSLARQSGVEFIYSAEQLKGIRTHGIEGEYDVESAVTQLLEGTRFKVTVHESGALLIADLGSGLSPADKKVASPASHATETQSSGAKSEKVASIEEVTVSGTRLDRGRNDVPTPILTLGTDDLQAGGYSNPVAALNDMTLTRGSFTPQSSKQLTDPGMYGIDLRGLGVARTLPLIDGRRFVRYFNRPDSGVVPSILIDHMDIVTGSASAAWGSDAVAGVVNMVLNNNLEGLRFNAQYAMADRGDGREPHFEGAAGGFFADHQGHYMVGVDFTHAGIADELVSRDSDNGLRTNAVKGGFVNNPAFTPSNGQKQFVLTNEFLGGTPSTGLSDGGLIRSGVNIGKTFNPDGTLRPFDFGTIVGGASINPEGQSYNNITSAYRRCNGLGRISYDLTDSLKVTADLLYSRVFNDDFRYQTAGTTDTISVNNAFLPVAIRNQMIAANQSSFVLGRTNFDLPRVADFNRWTTQATLALDGNIAEQWKWGAYYSQGNFRDDFNLKNYAATLNYRNSVDSILSPTTGQPVCRINVDANPANDDPACVPLNVFGTALSDPAYAAARGYAFGVFSQRIHQTLDTAGLTFRGEPFALPAGRVSVALGAEGRRETFDQRVPGIEKLTVVVLPFSGENKTKEGFAEVLVPVVKDLPLLKQLNFNGAARYIDDKTASLWAWKLGLNDQVIDGLQLRFTTSRDIRAPNLFELYNARTTQVGGVFDPVKGANTTAPVIFAQGGNPALVPETSRTTTIGLTIAPPSVPTLRISADYFDIDIENAISAIQPQQTVNLCTIQGVQAACGSITRDANGFITEIAANQLNFIKIQLAGIDAAADYTLPFTSLGTWRLHGLVTWIRKSETDNGLAAVNYVGSQGVGGGVFGNVRFLGNLTFSYEQQRFQGHLTARYLSSGIFDALNTTIQNDRIPAYVYLNLGASFQLSPHDGPFQSEIFANVNNLLNKEPPLGSGTSPYYDIMGRYFVFGTRLRF